MRFKLLKTAIVKTLPVMAGYLVLGAGFGIMLESHGYGWLWAFAMSFFIYAGSMQYVGISLITGGATLLSTALTTLMINARHLFYGVSMIEKYKGAGYKKPYLMFALTDETYSLLCAKEAPKEFKPHTYYFAISACNQFYWVVGSLIGSFMGSAFPFETAGIDFAMTALFVTVFVEQWLTTNEHRPAICGVLASVVCLLVFGADSFLIPSMIGIALLLTILRPTLEKGGGDND